MGASRQARHPDRRRPAGLSYRDERRRRRIDHGAAQNERAGGFDQIAAGKLRAFAGTIDLDAGIYLDDVYAQNKSLSEHAAADYHGRFLIELIQNANDVHE